MDVEDVMDGQDSNIDRERASIRREHAIALAREHYEVMHDGNGMRNEEIRLSHRDWPYGISTLSIFAVKDTSVTCIRTAPFIISNHHIRSMMNVS